MENLTQIWTLNTIQDKTHSNLSIKPRKTITTKSIFCISKSMPKKEKKKISYLKYNTT